MFGDFFKLNKKIKELEETNRTLIHQNCFLNERFCEGVAELEYLTERLSSVRNELQSNTVFLTSIIKENTELRRETTKLKNEIQWFEDNSFFK